MAFIQSHYTVIYKYAVITSPQPTFLASPRYVFKPSQTTLFLHHQLNAYQTIAITIMSTLAPKLLINIRREYYGADYDANETELSWNAERPEGTGNASSEILDQDPDLIDFGGELNSDDDIPLSVLGRGSIAEESA